MTSDCFGSSRNLSKSGSEITVFERQQSQMKFLQQQHRSSASETKYSDQVQKIQASLEPQNLTKVESGLLSPMMTTDPCLGWPELGHLSMPKRMLHSSSDYVHDQYTLEMSTLTTALSTGVPYRTAMLEKEGDDSVVKESPKIRETDQWLTPKFAAESIANEERIEKGIAEEDSNITLQSVPKKGRTSIGTSKENPNTSEVTKPEYIHVRARRGQATDSHSLAERVRREKISQRMRFLQDLVPGCNKITGKAGMLDEIINYVQALQRQVEFLSMKLAAVTAAQDYCNDPALSYHIVSMPDAPSNAYLPFNQLKASNISAAATTSAPASGHSSLLATAGFAALTTWDADFQAAPGIEFHQRRSTSFSSQPNEGDTSGMSTLSLCFDE